MKISPLAFAAVVALCLRAAVAVELPHHEQVAPGVHTIGFADKHGSANCGWIATGDATVLVDLPHGLDAGEFLAQVAKESGHPIGALVLTHGSPGDLPAVAALVRGGVKKVYLSPAARKALLAGKSASGADADKNDAPSVDLPSSVLAEVPDTRTIGNAAAPIDIVPLDGCCPGGAAAVHARTKKVLFAGPLVIHGPRAPLVDCDTESWLAALRRLAALKPAAVVPGRGSWGGAELVDRQIRFLSEVGRQVGYHVAQGRPRESLASDVRIPADYLVWMPYDTPTPEDIEHVYRELTVPVAPFNGRPPAADDKRDHALVLIGDQPHEPGHVEQGLRPVFEATGVVPHFTVDVRALSAENLARVRLLVILRDGLQRPAGDKADYVWMTPEQERAVVDFVARGGSFLNLHNSMGLYPDDGPYLKLVGGRYIGHGPLERFRVEVVDPDHPITRGVRDFSVADEQHTPPYDAEKVHLLLRNRSDDGRTAAAGWVYEPGKGRLCHLANGHTRESLSHPMYQRLMRNAVLWCLRRDVPADGSAIDASAKR